MTIMAEAECKTKLQASLMKKKISSEEKIQVIAIVGRIWRVGKKNSC